MVLERPSRSFHVTVSLSVCQNTAYNVRSQSQRSDVIYYYEQLFLYSRIRPVALLCDAERDLLIIATFLIGR